MNHKNLQQEKRMMTLDYMGGKLSCLQNIWLRIFNCKPDWESAQKNVSNNVVISRTYAYNSLRRLEIQENKFDFINKHCETYRLDHTTPPIPTTTPHLT